MVNKTVNGIFRAIAGNVPNFVFFFSPLLLSSQYKSQISFAEPEHSFKELLNTKWNKRVNFKLPLIQFGHSFNSIFSLNFVKQTCAV